MPSLNSDSSTSPRTGLNSYDVRVVIDVNVFVAAMIGSGPPHRILNDWLERRQFELVMCPELLAELTEVLTERPKLRRWITLADAWTLIDRLSSEVEVKADPTEVPAITRDPDDDHLVALGVQEHVDYIVTGDDDLLDQDDLRSAGDEPRRVRRVVPHSLNSTSRSATPSPRRRAPSCAGLGDEDLIEVAERLRSEFGTTNRHPERRALLRSGLEPLRRRRRHSGL